MSSAARSARRFRRVRAWLGRMPLTAEGTLWFLIASGLLLMGLVKGINLIILLACLLVVLVLWNAWVAYRQLQPVRAQRLTEGPAFALTPHPCTVRLHNVGRRAVGGLTVRDGAGRTQQNWFVTELPVRGTLLLQGEVTFPRRGPMAGRLLVLESGYPLGLARLRREADRSQPGVVFPQLGRLNRGWLRRLLSRHSPSLGRARGYPCHAPTARAEFHGLRPYRPGDSPRHIHWRTTARRGDLMVREYEEWPTDNLVLVVEAFKEPEWGDADDPALEQTISLAASICWEWCRQTGDRLVLAIAGTEAAVLDGVTGRDLAWRLLERLALEAGGPAETDALVAQLRGRELPPGPVLVISPRASDLAARLESALHRPAAAVNVCAGDAEPFFEL